jgi:hypothetical protein
LGRSGCALGGLKNGIGRREGAGRGEGPRGGGGGGVALFSSSQSPQTSARAAPRPRAVLWLQVHAAGFVLYGVKPANLAWYREERCWAIIDFGCCARIGAPRPLRGPPSPRAPRCRASLLCSFSSLLCCCGGRPAGGWSLRCTTLVANQPPCSLQPRIVSPCDGAVAPSSRREQAPDNGRSDMNVMSEHRSDG